MNLRRFVYPTAAMMLISVSILSDAQSEELESPSDVATIEEMVKNYCSFAIDQARELRQARLTQALTTLESQVSERLRRLEIERTAFEKAIKQQEELRNLAQKEIVEIYAGMEPAVAAAQLEKIDPRIASSVIRQLKARQASAILDEATPEFAAKIVRILAMHLSTSGDIN